VTGAYYNEHDKFAAAWLRELIKEGLIADGEVDERDIETVTAEDVRGFTQCHWFAGIGGWSTALRLAGWPDHRPVWTGSCPCQPYSAAGKGQGADDPRNLWPRWRPLIKQCRPERIFGEQVASAINHGWLDAVSTDLEAEGYAIGSCVLGAHSVGAPHIRQRLWFVAHTEDANGRRGERTPQTGTREEDGERRRRSGVGGAAGKLGQPIGEGLEGFTGNGADGHQPGRQSADTDRSTATAGFWRDSEWLACRDGKRRPTQPGLFPLAHGVPNRVGTLRGAGNAICPQVAQAFIESYLAVIDGL
jgi:DNA (cytosine-5)-methyltransferase 1